MGLQRLVRGVQEVAVLPAPRPLVVVNKVRASAAGPRPERTIRDVLGRFAGLEEVRMLPWAPDDCDEAVLTGRALPEVRPRSPLVAAVAGVAAVLDERCPDTSGTDRRSRRARVRV
ncbi:hypothetical protein [Phycicoccus avicenniae]|uniref:hypothetical protein n=1 Tax=Phycicoccus avicenniae TaxID=2828860 RepID=UPI003D2CC4F1